MQLDFFQKYLIAINIISFCVFTIDFVIYLQGGDGIKPRWICEFLTIIGGSAGALIAFILWDRKINKLNITWRVFAVCVFIIHVVVVLLIYGVLNGVIKWKGLNKLVHGIIAFGSNKWIWYYLLTINVVTFISFAVDKIRAIKGRWRMRELSLLGLVFIGGSLGGFIAMYTLRHKVNSPQFSFGIPLIILTQAIFLMYLIIRSI